MSPTGAVYLFPGQGGYSKGLIGRLAERHPATVDLFNEISDVARAELGLDLHRLRTDGDAGAAELLRDAPDHLQFAIYASSVMTAAALRSAGATASLHIGHSFGEIAALAGADACSVADGAHVVARRIKALGTLSADCGFMVAVAVDRARADSLLGLLGVGQIAVAGRNEDRQIVLSGPTDQMITACAVLTAAGLTPTRLPAPYPFHSPVLQPAVDRFAESLRDIRFAAPSVPVYSPILGRRYRPDDDFGTLLATHLVQPFDFQDAVRTAYAESHDTFVECGGRQTLTDIVTRILPTGSDWTAVATDGAGTRGVSVDQVSLMTGGPGPDLMLQLQRLVGATSTEAFGRYWAAERTSVVTSLRSGYEKFHAADRVPAAVETPAGTPSRDAVRDQLATLYGEALEYPTEVFTDDVSLEADLGVDSVKQTDLLARAARQFDLPASPDGFSVGDYPTFGHVVDLIAGSRSPAVV